jgi:glycosyltransferase involved in cell wall biosynthesis
MPAVSVVMNCRNGERYLKEALDSVYAQTFADWEIVFWDNASTDESASIARRYDARLRYFRSEEVLTLGAARNRALEQCRGEFIAFLDTDDLWLQRKLELQIPLFRDQQVGLVYSDCTIFDERGRERSQFDAGNYATGRCFDRLLSSYFLAIPTVVVRKSALGPPGEWFDASYHVSEEVDVFLRLAYRWKLAMRPEALARYRVHSASETWKKSDLFLGEALGMLDKYRAQYPDFDRLHAGSSRHFEDRARYASAVFRWRSGDGGQARAQLARLGEQRLKTRLLWAASFVPFALALPLLRRMNRLFPR